MEFCPGDLQKFIVKRGPLPEALALRFLAQIGSFVVERKGRKKKNSSQLFRSSISFGIEIFARTKDHSPRSKAPKHPAVIDGRRCSDKNRRLWVRKNDGVGRPCGHDLRHPIVHGSGGDEDAAIFGSHRLMERRRHLLPHARRKPALLRR